MPRLDSPLPLHTLVRAFPGEMKHRHWTQIVQDEPRETELQQSGLVAGLLQRADVMQATK
jgi:hypothetical protein